MIRSNLARAYRFLISVTSTSTSSPVATNGTKTTNSSDRPTPSPPKAMSSMVKESLSPTDGLILIAYGIEWATERGNDLLNVASELNAQLEDFLGVRVATRLGVNAKDR